MPGSHPLNARLQEASDLIFKATDGRLHIQLFPADQLGGSMDMLSQLRSGALEFLAQSGPILSSFIRNVGIYGLAFAFKTDADAWAALDGALGDHLRTTIRAAGLNVFDKSWANGYRQVMSGTHPIKTPEDLHGFKIRVPPSPITQTSFRALGAAPTPLSWDQVYSALQTKIVDGFEVPLLVMEFSKFYEVQKYVSLTNHMWDSFFLLSSPTAWKALPEDVQKIVAKQFDTSAQMEREDLVKQNQTAQSSLEGHGMVVNSTDADQFRAALREAGYYATWKSKFDPEAWGLLEKYAGKLA
jgi:tripartite ATP-independent transporter DctP family solute receptor